MFVADGKGMVKAEVSLAEFEASAAIVLSPDVRDFVAGGSGDEVTLRRNRAALDAVHLVPRVLAGLTAADPSTTLLNTPASMPVAVAPMAYQRLVHPDGEIGVATAAASVGVPYVISTLSSVPLEQIAAVGPSWFQLYWLRDKGVVESLLERAHEAGCQALMVTVDVPRMGRRLRDIRNEFTLPPGVFAANLMDGPAEAQARVAGTSAVATHTATAFAPALGWSDLEWLINRTPLPIVVKGVLDPRDARRLAELGLAGVVVSNHGGRQLDGAVASIDALPAVVDAVSNNCQVLLDSGVLSGTDVLRALALGADGVLVGRPLLWALGSGGADGAGRALSLLQAEVADALLLAGCGSPAAARGLETKWSTHD